MFFHKEDAVGKLVAPPGFGMEDVRLERSICTGEATIGFYNKQTKRLEQARFVNGTKDVEAFYSAYGWKAPPSVQEITSGV